MTNHAMNDNYFPNEKLRPYDNYKNMSTLNTYCGILSTCHNYTKIIIVDWILCPAQATGVRNLPMFFYVIYSHFREMKS
jgi:hypothetical protein